MFVGNETFIHGLRNVDIKLNELAQTVLFNSSDRAAVLNMWQATIGCQLALISASQPKLDIFQC